MKPKLSIFKIHPLRTSIIVLFAVAGTYFLVLSHAQTPAVSLSAATGSLSGGVTSTQCSNSTDNCVVFNSSVNSISMPTNFKLLDKSSTEVSLSWSPPTGWTPQSNNITGYTLYRDGIPIATTLPFTTNFLDTGLNPGSSHNYSVQALTNSGASAQTAAINVLLGNQVKPINGCETINSGGNYVLTTDITINNYCIDVENTKSGVTSPLQNVNIDCQGHTLTTTTFGYALIKITDVNNSMIVNCKFLHINAGEINSNTVNAITDSDGPNDSNTFSNNILGSSNLPITFGYDTQFNLATESNSVISNNTTYQGCLYINGDYNQITNNNVNCSIPLGQEDPYGISVTGNFYTIANNSVNGNGYWTPPNHTLGVDDDIVFEGNNDILAYNTVQNAHDCGMETDNSTLNDYIGHNIISGASTCALGSFFSGHIHFSSNYIESNTISDSCNFFDFEKLDDFSNNTFLNNNFTGVSPTSFIYINGGRSCASNRIHLNPLNQSATITNNIFKNNNLDPSQFSLDSPDITSLPTPFYGITDSSGNQWCPDIIFSATLKQSSSCTGQTPPWFTHG